MTARRTCISICAAVLGAAVLGGCGSDEEDGGRPIPASQVTALERELDAVERRLDVGGGACGDIENRSRPDVQGILDQVPQDVDPEVRDALQRSFDHLFELSASQCDEERGQETTPTDTEEAPFPTLPTEAQPPPPETDQQETDQEGAGGGRGRGNDGQSNGQGNRGGGQGQDPPAGDDGGAPAPEGE